MVTVNVDEGQVRELCEGGEKSSSGGRRKLVGSPERAAADSGPGPRGLVRLKCEFTEERKKNPERWHVADNDEALWVNGERNICYSLARYVPGGRWDDAETRCRLDIAFDIDAEEEDVGGETRYDLEGARRDAVRIVDVLKEHGMVADECGIFFTGRRGFAIHLMAEVVCQEIGPQEEQVRDVKYFCMRVGREAGVKLDTAIYGKGKLVRCEGARNVDKDTGEKFGHRTLTLH